MAIEKNFFGNTPDGKDVYIYTLKNNNGMKIVIINYGSAIVSAFVPNLSTR